MRTCAPHLPPRMCAAWSLNEAHILPQVEHGFRKDYRRIGPFIESLPEHPQVLAFTATATRSDLSYIAERLCMRDPKRLLFPIARKNIKLYIKKITVQGKTRKTRKLQNARLRLLDDVLRKYRKARTRLSSTVHASRMSSARPNGCAPVTIR